MSIELLRAVPLFSSLPSQQLDALAANLELKQIAAGEIVFQQGEPGHTCYVVLQGELEVLTYLNGEELLLDIFRNGQLVGEMALIDRSPRSATLRALSASELVVLTERDFRMLLSSDTELAIALLRNGSSRVRATNQRMIGDLERKNAELLNAYQQLQSAQAELIRLNRIEEELAVARRIQQSFLPRSLPQPDGWQVAAFSRGAQAVGGDFFDCIELLGGHIGFVVADACGKGVTAALFVALTRSLLRAVSQAPWAFQYSMTLDVEGALTAALYLTNDYIAREHVDSNMFITLFYGVLEPKSGAFHYANAGHNPPYLISDDGERIREVDGSGLPIGIFPSQSYDVMQVHVEPGYKLVLFSDGITEAMNSDGEPYGDERLIAVLRANAGLSASELVETVVREVDAYAGAAPQADDMTVMVVGRV
jgi:serine phosphatase RsbU (regulator of sigma subunit)